MEFSPYLFYMSTRLQTSLLSYIEEGKVVIPKGIHLKPQTIRKMLEGEKAELRRNLFALLVKLLKEYNYREEQIKLDVLFEGAIKADMIVYRDQKHKEPFIAVIFDATLNDGTIRKVKGIISQVRLEYFILGDKENLKIFKVQGKDLTEIKDVPFWINNKPLPSKVAKSKVLPPFRDEYSLKRIIYKCHTILYENLGHDPSRTFDEFIKIIFLKLYDERNGKAEYYHFVAHEGERPEDIRKRVRRLLEHARSIPVFSRIFNAASVELEINDFALYQIVLELQGFSFLETLKTIDGIDIMGRIYEQVVGRTFRGGLGQYYTPRTIAEFMVDFLDVDVDEKVLDPACGTGGFLTMCINRVQNKVKSQQTGTSATTGRLLEILGNYVDSKLYGIDIYDRICRVSRMNLLFHGGSNPNIFNINGLLTEEHIPEDVKNLFKDNSFQKIFSNPPFAGIVKDPRILSKFELGRRDGKVKSVTPEVLFIEKIVKLLEYGGKAGLVLPLGIFNNPSLKFVREFLFRNTRIMGVVGLPEFVFRHTGTSVKGALLFIERVRAPEKDYKVFMVVANDIGYDSTGRPTEKNELPSLVEAYKNKAPSCFISFSEMKDRIDANYYLPYYKQLEERIETTKYAKYPIYTLVKTSEERINPKKYPDKEFLYIETGCVDLKIGKIKKVKRFRGRKSPSRAKYVGRAGDILIPTARESLVGALLLPRKYDGIIVTNRFIVCKPRKDIVRPMFLYYLLKTPVVLELLKRESVGEIVPSISETSLKNVRIPIPPLHVQDETIKQIKQIKDKEEQLRKELLGLSNRVKEIVETATFEISSK